VQKCGTRAKFCEMLGVRMCGAHSQGRRLTSRVGVAEFFSRKISVTGESISQNSLRVLPDFLAGRNNTDSVLGKGFLVSHLVLGKTCMCISLKT